MLKRRRSIQMAACSTLCALAFAVNAEEIPSSFKFSPEGVLKAEELSLAVLHYGSGWKGSGQTQDTVKADAGFPVSDKDKFILKGKFATQSEAKFDFEEQAEALDSGALKLAYSAISAEGIESEELSLSLRLPLNVFSGKKVLSDGKPCVLPLEFSESSWRIANVESVKSLSIPLEGGSLLLKGDFPLLIQDDRKFSQDFYAIRLGFTPKSGKLTKATLNLEVSYIPFQFSCVDLSKAVNMGFKDDTADDQKGGWTDQGPENDLRMLKTGEQILGGVGFKLIKPEANDGKACIVLAGNDRPYFPKEAKAAASGAFRFLYLLHSAAWYASGIEAGKLVVSYQDGSAKEFSVGPKDVGDWWAPESRSNGSVVWTGENKSSYVGLFLSKFQIDSAKELSGLSFKSSGEGPVWAIVGASLSNDEVRFANSHATYVVENATWKPIKESWKDVEKGSALDFSQFLDAPAGKHGAIIVKDGHFAFEDGTPVRFYGVNLVGSANFLDKEWCERLADRLAMMGYNAVRFHHCDNGQADKVGTSSTGLHAERMDRMDYLFACLKKRGIYSTIDLYISRALVKGEIPEFPDVAIGMKDFKGLTFVLESAMKNWEDFARNFLTHVNPYTDLTWKDDPSIMGISLINEDTIFSASKSTPLVKAVYDKVFETWLKERGLEPDSVQKEVLRNKFLVETYDRSYARMAAFVRSLGTKIPLTDQNHWSSVPMCLMREKYDYVDNHFYWDHPRFLEISWKLPSACKNTSAIADYASVPGASFPSRIFGKPFTITEFDYANPNDYSAEGGALAGAYAALQDWDGLYRFAYAHSSDNVMSVKLGSNPFFDISVNPVKALSERMAAMLFLRGDAKSADIAYPTLVSRGCLDAAATSGGYPKDIWRLGLVGKSGSLVVKDGSAPTLPAGTRAVTSVENDIKCETSVLVASKERDMLKELVENGSVPQGLVDQDKGIFRSSTGEIELDATAQTFKAVTPRSESLIVPEGGSIEGDFLKIENQLTRGVFFAAALGKAPLRSADKVIIFHLTDSQPNKRKFGNEKRTVLEAYGELPVLIKAGKARLTLKGDFKDYKLYALEVSGRRIAEIPLDRAGGSASFEADVLANGGPILAYELVRE